VSKAEILEQLPKLRAEDRREIFDRLCDLTERDLIAPEPGRSWEEVDPSLRRSSAQ
jgi:hypothetical protein